MPPIQRDWKELVDKSGGTLMFVPEKYIDIVKAWNDKRVALNKYVNEAAKMEIETTVALQNAVYEIRKYLDENGIEDVWTSDVGFETNALRDGQYVLTVSRNIPASQPLPPLQKS